MVVGLVAVGLVLVAAAPRNGAPGNGANGTARNGSAAKVMLFVAPAEMAWADSEIEYRLMQRLTRYGSIQVSGVRELAPGLPAFPPSYYHTDSLVAWGKAVGADFVVLVHVESASLERRKDLHVPLLFHRYITVGAIEGELRVLDVLRGRLEIAEPFRIEEKGPRAFQATMDDDMYDPDLHLTAPAKTRFFRQLEEDLAGQLVRRIGSVIRMR